MSLEWEDKLLFVSSQDVSQSSSLLSRVNTLVLSPPNYPSSLLTYPSLPDRLINHKVCVFVRTSLEPHDPSLYWEGQFSEQ